MNGRIETTRLMAAVIAVTAISLSSVLAHDYIVKGGTSPTGPKKESNPTGSPVKNPSSYGEPVNIDKGEYVLSAKDVSVQGRSMPVIFERTYRSGSEYNSRFGYGWDMSYNIKIRRLHDPNTLILLDGASRKLEYKLDPASAPNAPEYTAPAGVYDFIQGRPDGTYRLYKKHGETLDFDMEGNLTAISDRNGNRITLEYAPGGLLPLNGTSEYFVGQTHGLIALEFKLTVIRDDIGRTITLGYDPDGRLSTVTDFAGRAWHYAYDPNNNLAGVTSPWTSQYPNGLTTTYAYDSKHNLVSITDAKGQTYLTNHYDTLDRVDLQTYGDGQFEFTYDTTNRKTTITDRKDFRREVTYNSTGNPTSEKIYTSGLRPGDPASYTTSYVYNRDIEKTSMLLPAGNSIYYGYDDDGNLTRMVRGRMQGEVGRWSFDEGVGSVTGDSANGNDGTVHGATWASGKTDSALSFDGSGDYVDIADSSALQLPAALTVAAWVCPKNEGTNCSNDVIVVKGQNVAGGAYYNFRVLMRNSNLFTWGVCSSGHELSFDGGVPTFNTWQHLTLTADGTTCRAYINGVQVASKVAAGPYLTFADYPVQIGGHSLTNSRWFNGLIDDVRIFNRALSPGEIAAVMNESVDADALVTEFTYEPRFNFIKTLTDPKGNITTYTYDYEDPDYGTEVGNLMKIAYPPVGSGTAEVRFTYNAFGQLETSTSPDGIVTRYEYYDATDPDGHSLLKRVIADYGSNPNCINAVTEFKYDIIGNIIRVTDATGNVSQFTYDNLRQLTQSVTPSPFNYVTSFAYDRNKNLTQMDMQTGDVSRPWQTTALAYNALDKLQTMTDPLSNVTTFEYDKNENRSLVHDAEDHDFGYVYDERDLLWKATDAEGNVTEYSYNQNGKLKEIKDAKGSVTAYAYDEFDRLTMVTYPGASTEVYTYDKNSNLTSKMNRRGQTTSYQYDEHDRMVQETPPDGLAIIYEYDIAGRLVNVTQGTDTTHYDYDRLGRVGKVTYPDGKQVAYEYDKLGRRTKLVYPDSTFITYSYDALSRLTDIKPPTGPAIVHYSYDALSRRTQADFANGTHATYGYDWADRLTGLADGGTAWTKTFGYTYDKVGNRESMTVDGTGLHSYAYDDIYQLIGVQYPATGSVAYNYDSLGNRTSVVNGGTTNYLANNLNQYTSVGGVSLTYDGNGNLASDGTNSYTYDSHNRLISATTPSHTAAYSYEPFGRRIARMVNGVTTRYIYDGDQVLAEYNGSGTLLRKYVYGPGIDEPVRVITGLGASYYYAFDGLGSVMSLSNSGGAIVETYSYDVFGRPNITSTVGNRFMFTGREYDAETGLYYYRARCYDPKLGRFLQTDPIGYFGGVNVYTYVTNSPATLVDPLGLLMGLGECAHWYEEQSKQAISEGNWIKATGWDLLGKSVGASGSAAKWYADAAERAISGGHWLQATAFDVLGGYVGGSETRNQQYAGLGWTLVDVLIGQPFTRDRSLSASLGIARSGHFGPVTRLRHAGRLALNIYGAWDTWRDIGDQIEQLSESDDSTNCK